MKAHRIVVCLCVALFAVSPSLVSAQQPAATDRSEHNAHAANARAHACVDPSDALAQRRLQDEPCKLPRYELPAPEAANEPRWPAYPSRSPETQWAHTMFWRFPVQPMGPYEVPRHSFR